MQIQYGIRSQRDQSIVPLGLITRSAKGWTNIVVWPFAKILNALKWFLVSDRPAELLPTTALYQELAYHQSQSISSSDFYLTELISTLGDQSLQRYIHNLTRALDRTGEFSAMEAYKLSGDHKRYTSYRPWWKKIAATIGYKFWIDKAYERQHGLIVAIGDDVTKLKSFLNRTERYLADQVSPSASLSSKSEKVFGRDVFHNRYEGGSDTVQDAYRRLFSYSHRLRKEVAQIPNTWSRQNSLKEKGFAEQRGDKSNLRWM